jgi:hypothetical protein
MIGSMMSRLNSGNACYHSVKKSSVALSSPKALMIKIYMKPQFHLLLYMDMKLGLLV